MSAVKSCSLLAAVVAAFTLLSGCVSQPRNLYTWGAYQNQVHAHLKNSSSPEQQIAALQKSLPKSATTFSAPPGYHAHLGLLYGEVGRMDDMRLEFETEKRLFPESAPFMDFMLNRLSKKQGAL